MMPLLPALFAALLTASPFASAAGCDPVGMTTIDVTRAGDSALATYRFGAPIACLALGDRGDVRKMTWQLQTAGAVLSEDGSTVRFAAPVTDFAVRLRAFAHDGALDRVYSPLFAFSDRTAVAVYTGYLYPASTSAGVFITFDGFNPAAPQRRVGTQRLGVEQTYMIVGQPAVTRRGQVAAVIDQAMPAWLLAQVNRTIVQGETALRSVTSTARALTYMITYTEPAAPHANWRGDTLDRLVRLNFMGAPWQTGAVAQKDAVDHFILHEMFHTASSPALDPGLPGAMSLSEGGAEAGAAGLQRRLAAGANAAPPAAIDQAIARCQQLTGATLADKEQQSQRSAPYACGMALQLLVAAAAHRDPLDIWHTLLRGAAPASAGWPAFLAAAAAAGKPHADVLAILDALAASRIDWTTGIEQLTRTGLLRHRTEAELAQPAHGDRFRAAAIFHLLEQTCRQRHGFSTQAGVYILDAPPGTSCVAPDQFRLVSMNGIDLTHDAYQAYHELARRCAAGLPVVLGDDQGRTTDLACKTAPPPVTLYTLAE